MRCRGHLDEPIQPSVGRIFISRALVSSAPLLRQSEWLGVHGPFDAVANSMGSPPQRAADAPLTNKNTNFSAIYIEGESFSMTPKRLDNLTPRQRHAYVMRFRWGWRLQRIAQELGITIGSASALVKRAQLRAGLGTQRAPVIRTRPRVVRPHHLGWQAGHV